MEKVEPINGILWNNGEKVGLRKGEGEGVRKTGGGKEKRKAGGGI